MGPIVMMSGMLRFISAIALVELVGPEELHRMASLLSEALGLPLRGVSPPLRKPHRSAQSAPDP